MSGLKITGFAMIYPCKRMIERGIRQRVTETLGRQVGETTLACEIVEERDALYLEYCHDRERLFEPGLFLNQHQDRSVLNEIHRTPELFQTR